MKHAKHSAGRARDGFRTKWGFILACIGSAVGMGNIWLFPVRVSGYGGGSFLLPYFFFVMVIGFSGVIGEMAFGRATRSGPVGAFQQAAQRKGWSQKVGTVLGLIPVFGSMALAIGYSVVVGWIARYTAGAYAGSGLAPETVQQFADRFNDTAQSFGNTFWQLVGLAIVFFIVVAGVAGGIEKVNKVLMPLFFVMFLGIAVYVALQPGAAAGYRYMFTVDPVLLADPKTWIYALGQAFFSLSLAGNGTLVYGSYLDDEEDILNAAWKVALFDTLAALLAALVIIPAMATVGETLTQGGPGLLFIFLPHLFRGMPGGRLLMIVFFTAVLFAGLTSLINLYEAPIVTLQQKFTLPRAKAVALVLAFGALVSVCIQGIVGGWMDFVSIYLCPLGAGLAGVMFYWVCGKSFARNELQKGRNKPIGRWLEPMTRYLFCGLTAVVFLLGIFYGGIG